METIKTYITDFLQSEMVQNILQQVITFILSFIDMDVVHDEVFIIIFAILVFIGLFFLVAVFTHGAIRAISIFFAFLMMIGAMTIFGSVHTGLLEVKFDEAKLQARAEMARKKAEENKPPEAPPAVPQMPLSSDAAGASTGATQTSATSGLPVSDKIHWEVYDPYEKPQPLEKTISAQANSNSGDKAAVIKAKKEDSPEVKAEKIRIGKQLAQIEEDLSHNIIFIDEHFADLDKKSQTGEIDKTTATAQKARWGIEKQGMILEALDEKAAVLAQADLLTDEDKANDMRKLNVQRQQESDKLTMYQNILQELAANNEAQIQPAW